MKLTKLLALVAVASVGASNSADACNFMSSVGYKGPDLAKINQAKGTLKILLVKAADSVAGAKIFTKNTIDMLAKMGYQIDVKETAEEGRVAAKSGGYQIILADISNAKEFQGSGAKVIAFANTVDPSLKNSNEYASVISADGGADVLSLVSVLKKNT